jgi:hypothetical protein
MSEDPYPSRLKWEEFCDVKPEDLTDSLPRHPTKRYKKRDLSKINKIVVHTTDRDWTVQRLAEYDIQPNHISADGLAAITYHDVILKTGDIKHCLDYDEISMHAGGYNTGSIAVAGMYIVTDPVSGKDTFAAPKNCLMSMQCHLGRLCIHFKLTPDRIFGHRELKGTGWFFNSQGSKRLRKTCPGKKVDLDQLRTNAAMYMQIALKCKGLYDGPIDGIFGKNSKAALERL